jgi:hypothetical protein
MTSTITEIMSIETTSCGVCGVVFGMPAEMLRSRKRSGATFWCPNGHQIGYSETDADRLRKELDAVKRRLDQASASWRAARDQADAAERSATALRGHNTRLRKRIAIGQCPACQQSFPDVAAHMADQHPTYSDDEHADTTQETEASGDQ